MRPARKSRSARSTWGSSKATFWKLSVEEVIFLFWFVVLFWIYLISKNSGVAYIFGDRCYWRQGRSERHGASACGWLQTAAGGNCRIKSLIRSWLTSLLRSELPDLLLRHARRGANLSLELRDWIQDHLNGFFYTHTQLNFVYLNRESSFL